MNISKVALLCWSLLCSCARHETTVTDAGTTLANQNGLAPGTGRLTITGSETLSKDFNVGQCRNDGPNSNVMMGGYSMSGDADEAASSKSIEKAANTVSATGMTLSGATSLNVILDPDAHSRPLRCFRRRSAQTVPNNDSPLTNMNTIRIRANVRGVV